jgi:hypothetical protein
MRPYICLVMKAAIRIRECGHRNEGGRMKENTLMMSNLGTGTSAQEKSIQVNDHKMRARK